MSLTTQIIQFTQTALKVESDKIMMIYVLDGTLKAKRFHQLHDFKSEDLFFVNKNEILMLESEKQSIVLVGMIDTNDFIKYAFPYSDQVCLIDDIQSADQTKDMQLIYRDCAFIKYLLSSVFIQDEKERELMSEIMIFSLLYDYNKISQNKKTRKVSNELMEKIYRISAQIDYDCSLKYSLEAIARQEGMQKSYFAQIWKQLNDCSYLESVTRKRLLLAERLLLLSDDNNEMISSKCGFSSKKYFYRSFQEWFHTTPSNWKKQFKELISDERSLAVDDAKGLIHKHLNNYQYIQTQTHFMKRYLDIKNLMPESGCFLKVDMLDKDNTYLIEKDTVRTFYGLDLLVHTADKMQIGLSFDIDMHLLIHKKEFKELLDLIKPTLVRFQNKVTKAWQFQLIASNLHDLELAKALKGELEKGMPHAVITIQLK